MILIVYSYSVIKETKALNKEDSFKRIFPTTQKVKR